MRVLKKTKNIYRNEGEESEMKLCVEINGKRMGELVKVLTREREREGEGKRDS